MKTYHVRVVKVLDRVEKSPHVVLTRGVGMSFITQDTFEDFETFNSNISAIFEGFSIRITEVQPISTILVGPFSF